MIAIGKLEKVIFKDDANNYFVYQFAKGGKKEVCVYKGDNPPPARKTVQVQLHGQYVKHPKHGKQFAISA